MRVIEAEKLAAFWARHHDAEQALRAWLAEARDAMWTAPFDVVARYPRASGVGGGRWVFRIRGNRYRLVVRINFVVGVVQVRWVGTHEQYDWTDAGAI